MGDDASKRLPTTRRQRFLSTSPVWGTTLYAGVKFGKDGQFLSTSPVWGTTIPAGLSGALSSISIHVPRMGDDLSSISCSVGISSISIHVPRMGDDIGSGCFTLFIIISIHVPRMGDDVNHPVLFGGFYYISIHVPRMGDDDERRIQRSRGDKYFYPRPPYGGRHRLRPGRSCLTVFLSTSPVWGTTAWCCGQRLTRRISIHVPRMGDDTMTINEAIEGFQFLSTSPVWGTTRRFRFRPIR